MKCRKSKELSILDLYGEIGPEDKAALEAHLAECPACRKDYAYTKEVFSNLDETKPKKIPEGNWQKYWGEIESHIRDRKPSLQDRPAGASVLTFPRWTYAAASLVLVFILGIVAGRMILKPDSAEMVRQGPLPSAYQHILNDHIEDIKPVMLDFVNYNAQAEQQAYVTIEREVLENLLLQNFLLRKALADTHPSAAQLLEDIDLVLMELKNLEPNDKRAPVLIRELIQKREILFKMEILQKT
jgi:hypothetical protein